MGPNGLRRVIARSARATSARSRPPESGDNPAQPVRSRNCSRPREQGAGQALAGNGTVRYRHGADASASTALSPEDRDQAGQSRAAGRRRPLMAQAGHTGEAQVTVAPVQHPVPGAPGCSGARAAGNRVHSLPAHQRQGRPALDGRQLPRADAALHPDPAAGMPGKRAAGTSDGRGRCRVRAAADTHSCMPMRVHSRCGAQAESGAWLTLLCPNRTLVPINYEVIQLVDRASQRRSPRDSLRGSHAAGVLRGASELRRSVAEDVLELAGR